jgi:hypothetical protein
MKQVYEAKNLYLKLKYTRQLFPRIEPTEVKNVPFKTAFLACFRTKPLAEAAL